MSTISISKAGKVRQVFIAAMHREISALVRDPARGWNTEQSLRKRNIHLYWNDHAIVACAGIGADRARLAVEAAMQLGPASELISIGWAGSCHFAAKVGDVLHPDIIVDSKTGERFFTAAYDQRVDAKSTNDADGKPWIAPEILVTVPAPAGVKQKAYLAMSYYAHSIDMEAAAVARVARAHDIPFHAIKAISDAHDFELPDMSAFTTPDGQFREAAFGFYLVTHPALWKSVRTMAKGSTLAAQQLRREIETHISTTGRDRTR